MVETMYLRFRWFVLFAFVVIVASTTVVLISAAPLIPTIFKSLGADPGSVVAATMMSFQFSVVVSAFLGGLWLTNLER